MTREDKAIVRAMGKFGGSFAQSIAQAAWSADTANYAKIKAAFPELWIQYEKFVTREES